MGQRIWSFPVWLTAVRIDRRQDLNFFKGKKPHLYDNSLVDYACNKVLGNCSQDQVGALSPFEVID